MKSSNCISVALFLILFTCSLPRLGLSEDNFCSRTANYKFYTSCSDCVLNKNMGCPLGSKKLTSGSGLSDCTYIGVQTGSLGNVIMSGCRHQCHRQTTMKRCCEGYWGPQCLGMFKTFLNTIHRSSLVTIYVTVL